MSTLWELTILLINLGSPNQDVLPVEGMLLMTVIGVLFRAIFTA